MRKFYLAQLTSDKSCKNRHSRITLRRCAIYSSYKTSPVSDEAWHLSTHATHPSALRQSEESIVHDFMLR